ncbi:hypothetical protein [Aneurinibacillus tyrosinisolvens]|uniref:hypothetical protein n=1 Tax=Aneurinibacillus tyrosinisolvens TaxID=1443435 RepID=UPI00063FC714|nr:hypothetical protein [Aneurinibacillus tyrosinisolvens]
MAHNGYNKMRKWERLSNLQTRVQQMEALPGAEKSASEKTMLDLLREGETVDVHSIHVGVSWKQADELNREIVRLSAYDVYK